MFAMKPVVSLPLLLILISLSSSLLRPAASLCSPRSSPYDRLLRDFLPPPSTPHPRPHPRFRSASRIASPSPSPSPSHPSPKTSPSPSPSPSPSRTPPRPYLTSSSPPLSPRSATLPPPPTRSLQSTVTDSVSNAINSLQNAFLDGSVKAVCEKTDYPDVCMSSIQSVAPNIRQADARTVLKLQMKATGVSTRAALERAEALADDPKNDKLTRSIFSVCTEGYEDAFSDLEAAEKYLDRNDKGSMSVDLSALFADYGGCGDAFTDAKMTSPMKSYEELLYKLASNCLAIGELV